MQYLNISIFIDIQGAIKLQGRRARQKRYSYDSYDSAKMAKPDGTPRYM